MVDDLEPLVFLGKIHSADIHARFELALRVVAEEGQDRNHASRGNVERQFILEDRELLDESG